MLDVSQRQGRPRFFIPHASIRLCLEELKVVQQSDHKALVTRVFWRYIAVMRVLQQLYWLEPAGSHGVWGLDDFHFLPFLWGSAQLKSQSNITYATTTSLLTNWNLGHKYIKPKSIHDPDIISEFSADYMYLACIKFINSVRPSVRKIYVSLKPHDSFVFPRSDKICDTEMAFPNVGRYICGMVLHASI